MRRTVPTSTFGNAAPGLEWQDVTLARAAAPRARRGSSAPVCGLEPGPLTRRANGADGDARPPGAAEPADRLATARLAGVPLRLGLAWGIKP
jgi:hypothetical protein